MARILAIAPALPRHINTQSEITATIGPLLTSDPTKLALLQRLHASSRVETRHFALPLEQYAEPMDYTESSRVFVGIATDLAAEALTAALASAGLAAADVDYLMFTSVTGVSAPSIDALLVARLGLRSDIKRVPIFGLGCVAGAAGIARVNDYLAGHPDEIGVLIAVELCSLTMQRGDDSIANLVASGLFADGAAAVVMAGDRRAADLAVTGPDVIDTVSRLYPESEDVIGFTASSTGFRIVLTNRVSEIVSDNFGQDVGGFLARNDYSVGEIDHWVAHPGGPRVLEAFADSLRLPDNALDLSWDSLARLGNMSSVSVLHILAQSIAATLARSAERTLARGAERTLVGATAIGATAATTGAEGRAAGRAGSAPDAAASAASVSTMDDAPLGSGETTMLFALGPGVSAELVLLRWRS